MEINIDFSAISNTLAAFFSQPSDVILWTFFINGGWIPLAFTFLWGAKETWMFYITNRWVGTQKKLFLAIDIPRSNAQSPMAVENMFAYLAGAHGTQSLLEIYWEGQFQQSFSFEIVSIDGYTQFIIRTPVSFRDLIETAIYAQYPDAEITEVGDYTEGMPKHFPDDEYDIWGAEFIQAKNPAYPIKTYTEFEHNFGEPETFYRDPMAALMNLCSSLRRGEQLWYQIIVKPIDMVAWTEAGDNEVKAILKEDVPANFNFAEKIIDGILKIINDFSEFVYSIWGDVPEKEEAKKDEPLKMLALKPKEKRQVETIHHKITKIGFDTKIRMIYLAKKDVMNKPKVANGFVGYMKQFAAIDLNNIKPDTKITGTSVHYFFKNYRLNERKNTIMRNYVNRDGSAGNPMGVLNTEELATIWHFPIESVVKAPMIQKAPGRKSEPPMSLPMDELSSNENIVDPIFFEKDLDTRPKQVREQEQPETTDDIFSQTVDNSMDNREVETKGLPPANLPFA